MGQNQEQQGQRVLADWVGYWVFISYTSGPSLDLNEPTKPVKGELEAITSSFLLQNYGPLGIEVKRDAEDSATIFMSWSAVLYIQGPPPEARAEIDKQMAKQRWQT